MEVIGAHNVNMVIQRSDVEQQFINDLNLKHGDILGIPAGELFSKGCPERFHQEVDKYAKNVLGYGIDEVNHKIFVSKGAK